MTMSSCMKECNVNLFTATTKMTWEQVIIVDPLVKTKNQGVFSGSYNLPFVLSI